MSRCLNKVFIISGGSSGIGEGCVRLFAEEGGHVIFCSNEPKDGTRIESEVNAKGPGQASFVEANCRIESDIQKVVNVCLEKYGKIDCLINNVGWHPDHVPIDDFSLDDLKSLMELNVYSYFSFAKFCLPSLRTTQGHIVNISSLVAALGQWNAVTYVMTKGAVSSFTRALAIDEAKHKVTVNTICPGNISTPLLHANAHARGNYDNELKRFTGESPLNRLGTTREVAEACLFFCTSGTFCNGVELNLSGGAELDYGIKARTT